MKKKLLIIIIVLVLFTITGCKAVDKVVKKKSNVEELLDLYIEAYVKADPEIAKKIFPPFYVEYAKSILTKDYLEKSLQTDKEEFGDDFTMTYTINKKEKLSDVEIDKVNGQMESQFNTTDKAEECYSVDGKMTFKGSKKETSESMEKMRVCKYNNKWYLLRM